MRGRRLRGRLQVVTKKSLTKLSGTTTEFLCYDNKKDVQKRYSKLRLREDKGFNFREQLLLVRLLFTYKPRTKIFSYEYHQFDSRRMALTY